MSAWRHDNDYDSWRSKYDRAVSDHENHRTCDSTMVHFDDLEHEVNELSQVEQDTQQELVSYFDNQKREIKSDIRNRQAEFVEDLDENFLRSQELMMYLKESVQWAIAKRSRHDQLSPP